MSPETAHPSSAAAPSPGRALAAGRAIDARRWLLIADVLIVLAGTLLVIAIRGMLHRPHGAPLSEKISDRMLMFVFDAFLILRLGTSGQYDLGVRFLRVSDTLVMVRSAFVAASLAVFLAIVSKGFLTGFTNYSRLYIGTAFLVPLLLMLIGRYFAYSMESRAFASGQYLTRSLVLGNGSRALDFMTLIAQQPQLGISCQHSSLRNDPSDVVSFEQQLGAELDDLRPDEIVLAFNDALPELQVAVVREAAYRGISVKVLPGVFESYQSECFRYGGVPVTTLFELPRRRFVKNVKLLTDRLVALLAIVAISPWTALIALCIKLEDRGPVFYRQERIGLNGVGFQIWKFRTMRTDAERALAEHLAAHPELQAEWELDQKLRNDPRITRVGGFLRKWSIDELPQLVNVLFGEMSLVGPRPIMQDELERYGARFVFSQALPGMTGLWQISGRNDTGYEERVKLDVYYAENWSFWLDMTILFKTIRVVMVRRGAY